MPVISFKAFSFLQPKLKSSGLPFEEKALEIFPGETAADLIRRLKLAPEDVEAVFVNGRTVSFDTVLKHEDRVALIPPGTPGPYRVLLGIKEKREEK